VALLLGDEQFYYPVVEELRLLGHDVVTVQERNARRSPDPDVLALATGEARAVLTINRADYIRLHRQSTEHAGIIACTEDRDYPALAARIDAAIRDLPDLNGRLIRIYRPG
jgi:hypothetical protein